MHEPDRKSLNSLPDRHQTAWQLAVIQLSGWTSLPILATSILILRKQLFRSYFKRFIIIRKCYLMVSSAWHYFHEL